MNCEEIKNLISEYLDGELDQGARKLVEDHLDNCPRCAEELAGLKECLKNLGSLKKMEPPPDFLSQVHARLEDQSGFKTAIKKIIYPIRFKIPLKVAGLAAAAGLIFYILNISPEKQSVQSFQVTSSGIRREETDKSLKKTSAAKSIPDSEEPMTLVAGRTMKPAALPAYDLIELEEAAPLSVVTDKAGGDRAETIELVLLIEPEPDYSREETHLGAPLLRMKAKVLRGAEAPTAGEEDEKTRQSPPLTRLKDLIDREGGEIILTEEMTDLTRRITIKLPADRYHMFMENLSKIGDLQPDRPVPPGEAERTIRLRLTQIMKIENSHD